MRYRETAELVLITSGTDADGYVVEAVETAREVFVDVQSVRRSEFYEAVRAGMTLAAAFIMRACDYAGEKLIDYDGKRYKVERAYTKDGELMELNCSEWKGGAV